MERRQSMLSVWWWGKGTKQGWKENNDGKGMNDKTKLLKEKDREEELGGRKHMCHLNLLNYFKRDICLN
jgi:hypothetical protein